MEVQTCAFESPAITNSDYYYGKINIGSVIMCFLIIYSTALSIVLSVKQLIQVIKEEELIMEMEEEEEEDVQTQVTKEEEEVIEKEVIKVDVQTQVTIEEEEIERKKKEQKREQKKEEELLLANYNAKERALALQAAYDEQLNALIKKKLMKLETQVNFNSSYNALYVSHYGNVLTTKQHLSNIIITHIQETSTRDIKKLDEEIITMAKKAGLFGENSDLLKDIEKIPDSAFVAEYKYIVSIM
jgi:hypothetical protein